MAHRTNAATPLRLLSAVALITGAVTIGLTPLDPAAVEGSSGTTYLIGESGFDTPRTEINTAGDLIVIGNSNLSCNGASNGCASARNGTGKVNNNDWPLVWVDVDNDPDTVNSSSADLAMPAGSTVEWAGLYWTGVRPVADRVDPRPPNDQSADLTARLKAPGDTTYRDAVPDVVRLPRTTYGIYTAYKDVTDIVSTGGSGTYFVADLWSITAAHSLAGWSLVVIYANQNEPVRSLTVYDGHRIVTTSGSKNVTINVSGFRTPLAPNPVNTRVGFMAAEGDRGAAGDQLLLNDVPLLSGTARPANNFFNSSVTTATANLTARNPDYINVFGFDTGMATAPEGALGNDADSATLVARTVGDNYDVLVLAFATDLYAPKFAQSITITETDQSPWSGEASWGDTLRITFTATLSGDGSEQTTLTARIPEGLTVDTGSLPADLTYDSVDRRLTAAPGATPGEMAIGDDVSYSFDVTVDGTSSDPNPNPAGTVRALDFTIAGTGETSGVDVTQTSERVRIPIETTSADLSAKVTWIDTEPTISGTTITAGAPANIAVDIRNNGPLAAPASVTITLPAGATYQSATGPGWTCAPPSGSSVTCERLADIAPDSAAPRLTITVDVPAAIVDGSTLTATATVAIGSAAPGALNDPTTGNNTASSTATVIAKTDLGITIQRSGSTAVGTDLVYTLTATNAGPSAAGTTPNARVTVTTTLPSNVTYLSATGSGWSCTQSNRVVTCTRASLGANQTAPPITLTTRVTSTDTILTRTEISGGAIDRNTDNNRASNSTLGTLRAKLIESVNNGVALDINTTTPTDAVVRVFNAGPSPLPAGTEVTHTMEFPYGAELVGLSRANGWVCDPATGIGPFSTECTRTLTEPWPALAELPAMTMSVRAEESRDGSVLVATEPMVLRGTVSTDIDTLVLDLGGATAQTDLLVNDSADLSITGTVRTEVSANTPTPSVAYTITNNGNAPDPGPITMTLSAPEGLTLTPASSGPWVCSVAAAVMTCTLNQVLASGATAPTINATLGRAGSPTSPTDTLVALVYSDFSDPDPTNNAASTEVIMSGGFVSIVPERAIDTRPSSGGPGPLEGGSVLKVDLSDIVDPAIALGAVINITTVDDLGTVPDDGRVGYVTAYPCGQPQPNVSNVNYIAGDVSSNTAITRIGDDGAVCLFVSDTVNVLVDITGWFSDGYFGDEPHRLLETRGPGGVGQPIPAGTVTRVQVSGDHDVPADAVGAAINVTAVNPLERGFITVWDCAGERPNTSNVNFAPISPFWAVANFSINELGDNGEICLYNSAATDLLVDVFGWFDDTFHPVANTRLLDTRTETTLAADDVVRVQIAGQGGIPADALSVAVNVTAVEATEAGFATVFACEDQRPNVSKINFFANETVANTTFIGLDDGGGLCVYTSGGADYLMDVFGWFTTDVIRT